MSKRSKRGATFWNRLSQFLSAKEGNWKVITLCIIAATTFWFFSALNKSDYTTQIDYPITFSYPTDSTYLLSQLPETIALQVNGGGWNLLRRSLAVNTQPVTVALRRPTETKFITGQSLTDKIEATLSDVRLDYVITDTLRINIDSAMKKKVKIVLDSTAINLEENHWITSPISVTPRTVKLIGPASVVSQASDTLLISLPDREIDEDYEATVPLDYINTMAEILPKEANVSFDVANFVSFSQRVPLTMLNFPTDSSAYLSQENVDISFWVEEPLAEDVLPDSTYFRVVADFYDTRPDSTLSPVVLRSPEFARRVTVVPRKLQVRYAP